MMWPYRLFVPDRDDPSRLHAYFSGCQGRHSDIHSTLPGERFARMREEWESNGAWGYTNIKVGGGGGSKEYYSPIKSTNCIHTHAYSHIHTHIHIDIHTRTHIHT